VTTASNEELGEFSSLEDCYVYIDERNEETEDQE